jgi:hypothetical protein
MRTIFMLASCLDEIEATAGLLLRGVRGFVGPGIGAGAREVSPAAPAEAHADLSLFPGLLKQGEVSLDRGRRYASVAIGGPVEAAKLLALCGGELGGHGTDSTWRSGRNRNSQGLLHRRIDRAGRTASAALQRNENAEKREDLRASIHR